MRNPSPCEEQLESDILTSLNLSSSGIRSLLVSPLGRGTVIKRQILSGFSSKPPHPPKWALESTEIKIFFFFVSTLSCESNKLLSSSARYTRVVD